MMRRVGSAVLLLVIACADEPSDGEDGESTASAMDGSEASTSSSSTTSNPATDTASVTTDPSTSEADSSSESGVEPGPDPIVPEPQGECPEFVSGEQTIGDLFTVIEAGTPGDAKGPLLLYFHGTGSSPTFEVPAAITPTQREEILGEGGLIVAPQSNGQDRGGFTPNGVWYEGEDGEGGDLTWVDHIVACAVANHNIDPMRIYTTGCSAGGLFASGLALKRSNYIAAATPNSGGIIVGDIGTLQDPERVPSVMTMHGGTDDTVLINFGQTSALFDSVVTEAGGFAVDCNHMSGHCLAPDPLREASWMFLKAHPFGTRPSPYEAELPAEFPDYCTIWSAG
jgi:predicted esterase